MRRLSFANAVRRISAALPGVVIALQPGWAQEASEPWRESLLERLSATYLSAPLEEDRTCETDRVLVQRLGAEIGGRLAGPDTAPPPADVASLALLLSMPECENQQAAGEPASGDPPRTAGVPAPRPDVPDDLGKGQEGILQGIERLADLPLSERMVITGDVVSMLQVATVPGGPELSSTSGRARMNFVARAVPASSGGMLDEGYFFVQMRAAGGPFDSSSVGGPSSLSAFNDIATDRSRFNEGTSRGNLYLAKAFYQQELRLGEGRVTGRVGIINQSDYFDTNQYANNENRQFINSALVNSAGYKTGISAPGFALEYFRPSSSDPITGMVYRIGYAVSRTDRAFTSPVWNGEIEMQTALGGREGSWRVGASIGNVAGVGGIRGFHLSADQRLSPTLGVFARYAVSSGGVGSEAFGPVQQSYSFGLQRRFTGSGQAGELGLGFSQAFPIGGTTPGGVSERILETYYRWQFAENFSLAPDFQVIAGSGGRTRDSLQTVFGFRVAFGL